MVPKGEGLTFERLLLVLVGMMLILVALDDRAPGNTDVCKDGVLYYRFIEHGDSVAPAFNKDGSLKTCDIHQ